MRKTVLIIDDDAAFAKLLEKRVTAALGTAQIQSVRSLSAARELLKIGGNSFDLVILDQHLGDGRGVELLQEGWFEGQAVLSISSDATPTIPGEVLKAGATYFIEKRAISDELFKPLVTGIVDRNTIQRELAQTQALQARQETVRTLVATLRHEINNPLGAVLGAAYLLKNAEGTTDSLKEAAELVEISGKRIKHVLNQLCAAFEITSVLKAQQNVFHIPGDSPWEEEDEKN
jgi:response regulator of citrate/malate metabolism